MADPSSSSTPEAVRLIPKALAARGASTVP
jgi:hypothetical protein